MVALLMSIGGERGMAEPPLLLVVGQVVTVDCVDDCGGYCSEAESPEVPTSARSSLHDERKWAEIICWQECTTAD